MYADGNDNMPEPHTLEEIKAGWADWKEWEKEYKFLVGKVVLYHTKSEAQRFNTGNTRLANTIRANIVDTDSSVIEDSDCETRLLSLSKCQQVATSGFKLRPQVSPEPVKGSDIKKGSWWFRQAQSLMVEQVMRA